ncbi:MAG: nucleotidyltransferase domain-containing protein [Pseudomonadota bacterium]
MALSKDEVIALVEGFLTIYSKKHKIRQAYIFGSFAKGTAKDYSDIDVALILEELHVSENSPFDENFQIFHEAQQHDSRLEVLCFPQDEFDRNSESIIKRIKEEGIRVM